MPQPIEIPLFPLNTVLFPGTRLPLRIFEDRYKRLFEDTLKAGAPFGIALIRDGSEVGGPATPVDVGTLAEIESVDYHADSIFLLCRGTRRFRVRALAQDRPYLVGHVDVDPEPPHLSAEALEAAAALRARLAEFLAHLGALARGLGGELRFAPLAPVFDRFEHLYAAAFAVPLDLAAKQTLLEEDDAIRFIRRLDGLLDAELDFLRPEG